MSQTRAYEREPGRTHLETRVVDTGVDGARPFVVQTIDGVVRHILAAPVPAGPVPVELDWSRRFDHM